MWEIMLCYSFFRKKIQFSLLQLQDKNIQDLELYHGYPELSQTVFPSLEHFAFSSHSHLGLISSHPSNCNLNITASRELSCPKPHSKLGRSIPLIIDFWSTLYPSFVALKSIIITKLFGCDICSMCAGVMSLVFCSCFSPGRSSSIMNTRLLVSTWGLLKVFYAAWVIRVSVLFSIVCGYFWLISIFLSLQVGFSNGYFIGSVILLCVGWEVMLFQCLWVFPRW